MRRCCRRRILCVLQRASWPTGLLFSSFKSPCERRARMRCCAEDFKTVARRRPISGAKPVSTYSPLPRPRAVKKRLTMRSSDPPNLRSAHNKPAGAAPGHSLIARSDAINTPLKKARHIRYSQHAAAPEKLRSTGALLSRLIGWVLRTGLSNRDGQRNSLPLPDPPAMRCTRDTGDTSSEL